MDTDVVKCHLCGKCCVTLFEDGQYRNCKYLDKTTKLCSIYEFRIGADTGNNHSCCMRKDTPHDYPDCPYNTGKPIHPKYGEINTP